jgi:chromosomal replication initiation ATPase DnaA
MSAFRFIEALRGTVVVPPSPMGRNLSISQICRDVMKRHGITHGDFYSRSKGHRIAHARQEAMAIAHSAGKSLPMIGRHFGFDHTTILHGIRAHAARQEGK